MRKFIGAIAAFSCLVQGLSNLNHLAAYKAVDNTDETTAEDTSADFDMSKLTAE